MITIHASPLIPWQANAAPKIQRGLSAIGLDANITQSRVRESDVAILLGTTFWRLIESSGKYLLIDRASWGDPHYVSMVWDGHGRRGDHKVPGKVGGRQIPVELQPWRTGSKVVLCGQTETYSPNYQTVEDWYKTVDATHFRGHPTGYNPTGLPAYRSWDDVGLAVTLNSSIGVEAVINGVPTLTMDEGAMAWDVSVHQATAADRRPWLEWLAWTQWHWDEIEAGLPIKHLFEDI